LGIDNDLVRSSLCCEVEGSLRASGNDSAEKNVMTHAVAGVERHADDKRARHTGLKKLSTDDFAFIRMVRGVL